jgi:sulfite reductase beta subunit-like hemoprotein
MTIDYQRLRVEGVYKQNEAGHLMQRIKVPAGVLSAEQAEKVAEIADRFAGGRLHLTTRCSIELHWLQFGDLPEVQRLLAAVGLTGRGACGGAVRGVSSSTPFAEGFAVAQVLARKLHRHFAGNPHFEGLPKKFKIAVDAGYDGARHLIQDVGLVYVGTGEAGDLYDVWLAGGLGREPMAAFRFEEKTPERRLVPLIEATLRVYGRHAPAGRRLKHVVRELGEKKFRRLLAQEVGEGAGLELADAVDKRLTALPHGGPAPRVEAAVFAGELTTEAFRRLAAVARRHAGGYLVLTADQNVAFLLAESSLLGPAQRELAESGFAGATPEEQVTFRICPGSHECRLGLAPTREVAKEVIAALGEQGRSLAWAISGCPNSCAQPQLAEAGIIAVKSVREEDGARRPLFDLYRREGEELGRAVRHGLDLAGLLQASSDLG